MNLTISGHHLEVSNAIREYVTSKLERVTRHYENVIDLSVKLSVDPLPEKEKRQRAEINLNVSGKKIHVESVAQDMYAAIDLLMDKLARALLKHKGKQNDHTRETIKRMPEEGAESAPAGM